MSKGLSIEQGIKTHGSEIADSMGATRVIPSGGPVGAEIRGVNLALPVPPDVQEALRKAWADHMVLVFRNQHLVDEQLLDASNIFGGKAFPQSKTQFKGINKFSG